MDFVSIAVKDAAVMAALSDLARRTNDLSIPMQDIGVEFSELIRQTFSDSQSPWGVKWDKLSAVTQAKNKGRRAGGEPLRDTGRLMASIAPKAADGGQAVTIGATNVKYANTHQFGVKQGTYGKTKRNGPIPWGNVPSRPFMPILGNAVILPDAWSKAAQEIIADYIVEAAL